MRRGLGQGSRDDEQEMKPETLRLDMEWTEVMAILGDGDEGSGMQFPVYSELVEESLQCSEMWNIKDGMVFQGEGKFYFKYLCAMSLWDIQEEVFSRHLKTRVWSLIKFTEIPQVSDELLEWCVWWRWIAMCIKHFFGLLFQHSFFPLSFLKSLSFSFRELLFPILSWAVNRTNVPSAQ